MQRHLFTQQIKLGVHLSSKLRSVIKIHGGKSYLAKFIINHFPQNYRELTYLEPFGGGASVLLNKNRSAREIYNDLHQPTANIFSCLVNNKEEIIKYISKIDYNLESFQSAQNKVFEYGSVQSAVDEIVLRRMSRGGLKKSFSWSERMRGGLPGDVNAWNTFKKSFPDICDRFQNVEVYSKNGLELLDEFNSPDVLTYVDPPYLKETRTAQKAYDCEMSNKDHQDLADFLKVFKGKVLVSGYDSDLYRHNYKDWRWVRKEMPNNSGQGKIKQRRVECLIMNY